MRSLARLGLRASVDDLTVAAVGARNRAEHAVTSVVLNITFDCADPGTVARFWASVTGWVLRAQDTSPGHEEYSVGPPAWGGARLYFVAVDEPKVAKNRLHLDMVPRDGSQQQEIARMVQLGASVLADQPPGVGWVILADPEGNEYCVEGVTSADLQRSDKGGPLAG